MIKALGFLTMFALFAGLMLFFLNADGLPIAP